MLFTSDLTPSAAKNDANKNVIVSKIPMFFMAMVKGPTKIGRDGLCWTLDDCHKN